MQWITMSLKLKFILRLGKTDIIQLMSLALAQDLIDETLFHAPKIKFFTTQIETDNNLETSIQGLFVAGDGPGFAGNTVSAATTGLIPAKHILAKKSRQG